MCLSFAVLKRACHGCQRNTNSYATSANIDYSRMRKTDSQGSHCSFHKALSGVINASDAKIADKTHLNAVYCSQKIIFFISLNANRDFYRVTLAI